MPEPTAAYPQAPEWGEERRWVTLDRGGPDGWMLTLHQQGEDWRRMTTLHLTAAEVTAVAALTAPYLPDGDNA